ncbi:MAG: helicase-related protein [Legionellaceae bacterium]|nr:helicase-related protein [Legionellaceae bacterium]
MPNRHIPAQIQVEYISDLATDVETLQEAHVAPDLPIQLVDRNKFIELLRERRGGILSHEDLQFWDILFGNYPHREPVIQGMDNPHVRYLTIDSYEKILKHRVQFSSGVDFQHLPSGFLLTKNPIGGGVCDVLHYSEYYAQFQPKDDNNVLALTLMTQDELTAAPVEQSPFSGPQAVWYDFLQRKRISPSGVYCTELQLTDAFIRFSNIIQGMGLDYYQPDFAKNLLLETGNPIVLLGHWETVLSNPRLKAADVTKQWQALPQLPLMKSHEAIRAITDYARDQRSCGFIRPDMELNQEGFEFRSEYGFRPKDDFKTISGENIASFWRYIAYQPKRNSVEFYEKALARLSQVGLSRETREQMIQILAASTVRDNHSADSLSEEEQELKAWDTLCHVIEVGPFGVKATQYTDGVVSRLHALPEQPNIAFLESTAQHIKDQLIHQHYLVILSNRLSLLVTNLRSSLYHGAKFYFINRAWQKLSINEYVVLQYNFYRLVGGVHAVEGIHDVVRNPDHALSHKFTLLARHLSTFNLLNIDDITQALAAWPAVLSKENQERLDFCFDLFNDAQTNDGLTRTILAELIQYVSTIEIIEGENWRLVLLAHLKQFAPCFADQYFEKKEKQIRDVSFGLTTDQIAKVRACSFPDAACTAIISLESAIVQQNPPRVDAYLARINDQLVNLKQIITPEDFILFTEQLDEMREGVATNYAALPILIDHIITKRTLEGFSQIFVRNEIEKSTQNLLEKFAIFIQNIKSLTAVQGLKLDTLVLQETLATLVLNSASVDMASVGNYQRNISDLIGQLNQAATAHPQIKHYLLDCLNHMPDKNTEEYLKHVLTFGKNIQQLSEILQPGENELLKENMFVIYSLLVNYHKRPVELSILVAQVRRMPAEQWPFMMTFLSRLIDNNQSIVGLGPLIKLLIADERKLNLFTTMCKTPPYPNVKTLSAWLQTDTFEEQYAAFSLKPYGDRRLDYAFKYTQYKQQQGQFVGVQDIFTDAIGRRLEAQLSENRTKSIQVLTEEYHAIRQETPLSDANKLKLVCLCVEMLARTASQLSHDKPPKPISQELNTTQVMALYAKMVNPSNRLISQIDTGEGKSRIMMILAACQAAQGKTVDFLTSDMPLAERDYLSYKQFFTSLGIPTSLISLNTPSQLYQKGGVNFTDNSQLLLLRNRSDIERRPFAYLDERKKMRCLLIDEVDKFVHDKSKDSYNYAVQSKQLASYVWVYPNLVKFVESLSLQPDKAFDPDLHVDNFLEYINKNVLNRMHKASLAQLVASNPAQIKTWLRSAHTALRMEADKHYIITEPDKDKLYLLRDNEGHARYSRKIFVLDNGRPVEGSSFSDGVHQCLCAKENIALNKLNNNKRDAFIIMPENETQRASFPVTFMANYDEGSIYGVSGTTRSAAPLSNLEEINYEKYTYLTMPREKPLIRDDKNVWIAKNEAQQITFLKRAIIKKLVSGCPVLLICKDDQQSLRLHNALEKDPKFMQTLQKLQLQRVHGLTTKQDEIKAIRQAGTPNFVTISTAGMLGRGVDINSDNLLVLAAYVPTEEDEIQIKGRTARIGKPGEYRMIPNMSDPDYPLNGYTYNVHNEVVKSQKQRQCSAAFQKEVSSLYAFFLEDITKQFLDDCEKCSNDDRVDRLKKWQRFLGKMQKDWEPHRKKLLEAVEAEDQERFSRTFNEFTEKWLRALPVELVDTDTERQAEDIAKTYTAIMAQQRFFTPLRQPIKVQRNYDPSDDGQARVYSTLFAKTRATLRGERRLFADFHAWRDGRGYLFPDLMAVLHGERKLFANLYATISRWIAELSEWLHAKKESHFDGLAEIPPPPSEGDPGVSNIPVS